MRPARAGRLKSDEPRLASTVVAVAIHVLVILVIVQGLHPFGVLAPGLQRATAPSRQTREVTGLGAAPPRTTPCDTLLTLKLANVRVARATFVDSGRFVPPAMHPQPSPGAFTAFGSLPPFCRAEVVVQAATDSDIGIEVWFPLERWNGRYLGVGNDGDGGSIDYRRLGEALRLGYAASSTDTGHRGAPGDSSWATGHPGKQADFDYRAIHETALVSKALVHVLYGSDATHSYFGGCSNGGRQGLMEAERFPADYDGILAGAPAISLGFHSFLRVDLRAYLERGGKLIIWHGGADTPKSSAAYYQAARQKAGGDPTRDGLQLYVVPAMGHCGGGPGPNDIGQWLHPGDDHQHSLFMALEDWVEDGRVPDGVTARRFAVDGDAASGVTQARVIYPYPRAAARIQQVR